MFVFIQKLNIGKSIVHGCWVDKGVNFVELSFVSSAPPLFPSFTMERSSQELHFSGSPTLYGFGLELTNERNLWYFAGKLKKRFLESTGSSWKPNSWYCWEFVVTRLMGGWGDFQWPPKHSRCTHIFVIVWQLVGTFRKILILQQFPGNLFRITHFSASGWGH